LKESSTRKTNSSLLSDLTLDIASNHEYKDKVCNLNIVSVVGLDYFLDDMLCMCYIIILNGSLLYNVQI